MANIKSAKKRILVIEKKTLQNKIARTKMKTIIKKFYAAVESGDKAAATEAYKVAVKCVDQAAGTLLPVSVRSKTSEALTASSSNNS